MEQLLKFHHSQSKQQTILLKNGICKNNTIHCLIYNEYLYKNMPIFTR
jgi:hypothetical protein